MPVYNAGEFAVEAIESILNQTYRNFELIIVDDASIDDSWKIIVDYSIRWSKRIRVVRMGSRLGKGGDAAANEGIRLARGEYIARMDADDVAKPKRLEKQVAFLERNKEIFLVGSSATIIDKNGEVIGEKVMPKDHKNIVGAYTRLAFHPLVHSAVMFRNERKKDFYKVRFSANNDYYTFLELLANGRRFANLPEKLVFYRIHSSNDSLKDVRRTLINVLKARHLIAEKYGYEFGVSAVVWSRVLLVMLLVMPTKVSNWLYILVRRLRLRRKFTISWRKWSQLSFAGSDV